jgi:hypothetical protein
MDAAFSFVTALIMGGMVAFQVLFAPLLFIKVEMSIARKFIRIFFPYYYLYFGVLSLCGFFFSLFATNLIHTGIMMACMIGFIVSRQLLVPRANIATDTGNKTLFVRYCIFSSIPITQ